MTIAFDIDGTLTESRVLSIYKSLEGQYKIAIVTRRTPELANRFIAEENLSPDIVRSGAIKSIPLNNIEDGEVNVYIGNRLTDYLFASISGWHFVPAQTVTRESILNLIE